MVEFVERLAAHGWDSLKVTGLTLFMVMGPGMILALCMHGVSTRVKSGAWALLGPKLYLGLFGWLGICIHELGHAIMCVIFGHRVETLRLFAPDASTRTLGYVKHSFNPHNPYQVIGNFFIALGPIILGTAVIWLAARYLLPRELVAHDLLWHWSNFQSPEAVWNLVMSTWDMCQAMFQEIFTFKNGNRWQSWVFAYILVSVGSGISLSWEDISGGLEGFGVFFILAYIVVFAAGYFGGIPAHWINASSQAVGSFYPLLLFTMLLNGLLAIFITIMNLAAASLKN
ncbi:MAG: M50 family metallopeptidase [Desulfatibacillum sp.]|nr:M50 family metallopeptidase [Desulfatibacillum sp.]